MAKKEYDSFVTALIDIKGMISTLKSIANVIAIDLETNIIYIESTNYCDRVVKIKDPNMLQSSKKFAYHLINTVEAVGFNKALKKTKTVSDISDDKSIIFTTDGYDNKLEMPWISSYQTITKQYRILFKDIQITKLALNINPSQCIHMDETLLDDLKHNKLIEIKSDSNNLMFISKAMFGNIKKTQAIYYATVDSKDDTELVVFIQIEDGFEIYSIYKFLKVEP